MQQSQAIAVIGIGYVGKAFAQFIGARYPLVTYDLADGVPYPKEEIDRCRMAVICVPTPMRADGVCDTSHVEAALARIDTPLVLLKSTVAPGTTDRLRAETGKRIVFSPEYIGESKYNNPVYRTMNDTPFHICGGAPEDVKAVFEIIETVAGPYATYYACEAVEAELIKYMENSFLAAKVSFCNEFYEIAKVFGADWHKVREGWLLDERVGRAFSSVFAGERGFGGKCLPKDISGIAKASQAAGYRPALLNAIIQFNDELRNGQA